MHHKMNIKLIANECNNPWFKNGGYEFHMGLICIAKNKEKKNLIEFLTSYKDLSYKDHCCWLGNIVNQKMQLGDGASDIVIVQSHYIRLGNRTDKDDWHYCDIGKNIHDEYFEVYNYDSIGNMKNIEKNSLYHLSSNINDTFAINITKTKENNLYQLYFTKNDQILGQNASKKDDLKDGRIINLNFDKNYYLDAMSSVRCNCHDHQAVDEKKGFQFEISMNVNDHD